MPVTDGSGAVRRINKKVVIVIAQTAFALVSNWGKR